MMIMRKNIGYTNVLYFVPFKLKMSFSEIPVP